jgi:mRNA interferase MazF
MILNLKQFDIWLANLDPAYGSEPEKLRPVLIVQNNFINTEGHNSTVVCPLTTNLTKGTRILRIRVTLKDSDIFENADILIDQIRAIDNKRFVRYLATVPDDIKARVKGSLSYILDLED